MKVLHVIPAVAARYGGPSVAVVGMCRALRSAGLETLIASTDADGPTRLPAEPGRPTTFEGVPAIFFQRQASEAFKWSRELSRWLRGHVAEFDVVHIHAVFAHASVAAGRACRLAGVPYVVRPLGTLDPWSLKKHAWRKKVLLAVSARRLLSGAAAVHYTTAEEQRLAEDQLDGLAPGVVVPLGIDDEAFASAAETSRERPQVLLTMSRLHEKKGIDVLIEAFHAIAGDESLRGWRLVIAGDGPAAHVAQLRRQADAGAGRSRISFPGWVEGVRRHETLAAAALFVLPSHQENFGIAIVEAMAAGLPVIVSPGVNLASDIADAGAGWVADRTPGALAATLRAAMSDAPGLRQRGDSARQFAERFRWPVIAERLRSLYERVQRVPSSIPASGIGARRAAEPLDLK